MTCRDLLTAIMGSILGVAPMKAATDVISVYFAVAGWYKQIFYIILTGSKQQMTFNQFDI